MISLIYSEIFKLENVNTWKPVIFDKYSKKFMTVDRSIAWSKPSYEALRDRFNLIWEVSCFFCLK